MNITQTFKINQYVDAQKYASAAATFHRTAMHVIHDRVLNCYQVVPHHWIGDNTSNESFLSMACYAPDLKPLDVKLQYELLDAARELARDFVEFGPTFQVDENDQYGPDTAISRLRSVLDQIK